MPKEIRPQDVGFLLDWLADNDYAVQTRRGYLSSLRRWCAWGGNRTMDRWPKPRFPADKRPNVDWLTADQTAELLACDKTPLQEAVVALELREGLRHVEVIDIYGDMIEHGPYLYGEYSDDVDEAMIGMSSWGALADWCITEYGKDLLEAVRQITDDEDIIKVLERSP